MYFGVFNFYPSWYDFHTFLKAKKTLIYLLQVENASYSKVPPPNPLGKMWNIQKGSLAD